MTRKKTPTTSTLLAGEDQEQEYEAFVRGLEIIGIALMSCECRLDRSSYFKAKDHVREFNQDYILTDTGKNHFDAVGNFSIAVAESESALTDSVAALTIKFSFQTHFHGTQPILIHHAERFTNSELRLILVPYARQFVSCMSNQMVVGPIIIPLTKGITRMASVKKRHKA